MLNELPISGSVILFSFFFFKSLVPGRQAYFSRRTYEERTLVAIFFPTRETGVKVEIMWRLRFVLSHF